MRKRQKNFIAPLLAFGARSALGTVANTAMIGGTVYGIKQSSDANEAQEEANKKMEEEMKRHNRAMEAVAKKNAEAAINAEESQKSFAASPSVMKNLTGFAKDIWTSQKGNVKKAVGMGAGFAGLGYAGNRIATSIKDHKENNDEGNKKFLKKAAIIGGTIGGGLLAARTGLMGPGVKEFMKTGKGGDILRKAKDTLNPIVRDEKTNAIKKGATAGRIAMNAGFMATPTISYLAQRKSQNDMVNNTVPEIEEEQRSYAFTNIKSIMGSIKNGWNTFRKHPGLSISGAASKAGSFAGFYGEGGREAVQRGVNNLANIGAKSGNSYTKKTAEWLKNHEKTANYLAGAGSLAGGGASMKIGSSLVDKTMKAIDRDAYKMEEAENGKV